MIRLFKEKNECKMAGIGDLTGSIEVGKCADLIVTAKNPLEDLRALRNVELSLLRVRCLNIRIFIKTVSLKQNWITI